MWKNYDIFNRQKLSTFKSSRPAVIELAARYKDLKAQLRSNTPETLSPEQKAQAEQVLFLEMCEICLWGNATDLSLLTNLTYEDIQKLQGSKARKAAESNIIVNDLPVAFSALKRVQAQKPQGERRIDIVLDNAGFELFVDLILAGCLLESGLATSIVLHPKSIPWVSFVPICFQLFSYTNVVFLVVCLGRGSKRLHGLVGCSLRSRNVLRRTYI